MTRFALVAAMAISAVLTGASAALAAPGDRTLTFYYTHTKETGTFTFRRNGQYDQAELRRMNQFLRDWRRNEPAKMDPALFDLIWQVYREVGASKPIHIVSAYRSPKTNAMLASKSSGVADNSQHMKGNAMDFFIPGVPLNRLREVAMRHQVGGVGFYPTSGSPFVHLDTGSVRAWPRMTRAQLKKVFPDGRTLHLPNDGKPLSEEGRRYAMAEWQKCRTVPCNGASRPAPAAGPTIMVAANSAEPPIPARPSATMMQVIYGTAAEERGRIAAAAAEPTQRNVRTIGIAPVPAMRTAMREAIESRPVINTAMVAPVPAQKSQSMLVATRAPMPGETAVTALAALSGGTPARETPAVLTAYVPPVAQDPGAQQALRIIIEREAAALSPPAPPSLPKATTIAPDAIRTASIGGAQRPIDALRGMFDMTWNAVTGSGEAGVAQALQSLIEKRRTIAALETRQIELFAPDLDHVNDTMVHPVLFTGGHFAELSEAEGYLDKTTELGPLSDRMGFMPESTALPVSDRFVKNSAPLLSPL